MIVKTISGLFVIFTAFFFGVPYTINFFIYYRIKHNSLNVMAKIVEKNLRKLSSRGKRTVEYEYKVLYEVHEKDYEQWLIYSVWDNISVGSIIPIQCNKNAPEECMIIDSSKEKIICYRFFVILMSMLIAVIAVIND